MNPDFTYFANLSQEIEPPTDGILTRTLHNDSCTKVVLFGFSENQELSEHTASSPAILHFLSGEATVTLGNQTIEVEAGAWVHMAANLPHTIHTKSPMLMELLLLKTANQDK